jgi:hypothetical protein
MKRRIIAGAGALISLGFLFVSALANYMFNASLGTTPWEATLYGSASVLPVAWNAFAPFYLSWSIAEARYTKAATIGVIWAICLLYSVTSALGFAAQNRESTSLSRQLTRDAYDDIRRELFDLEARRKDASGKEKTRLDNKIDETRRRLAAARNQHPAPADAQSQFLSALTYGLLEARHVRVALAAIFAVMVELCATLGLFAALSHSFERQRPAAAIVQPSIDTRVRSRWTPRTP